MSALAAVFLFAAPAAPPEEIVLLDFTASYCAPCKSIKPQINELIREGYPIRPIDVSRNPEIARRFNVQNIPTFVLLVNGRERKRLKSAQSVKQLKPLLDAARREVARNKRPAATAARQDGKKPDDQPSLLERVFAGRRRVEPEELEVVLAQEPDKKPDAAPAKAGSPTSASKSAMASSVKIRVTYDGKVQFGSGTIIQSLKGRTIILTCAHIMDQAGDNPKVRVDVYSNSRPRTYVGTVIAHDIKSDVGIISIPTSSRLPVVPVARPSHKLKKKQKVFSIGCNNGKDPTREVAMLSGIDRYVGPNNLETNHAPDHGRSGGGLFDLRGRLIGVCSAADRKGNHGLYAGHRAVYEMLKKHKLLTVYGDKFAKGKEGRRTTLVENPLPAATNLQAAVIGGLNDAPLFDNAPLFDSSESSDAPPFADEGNVGLATTELGSENIPDPIHTLAHGGVGGTTMDELSGAAEVTVVIRPRDPRKLSRIVVIPKASSNFVSMLEGELGAQPQPTSYVRPVGSSQTVKQPLRMDRGTRYRQRDTLFVLPLASRSRSRQSQDVLRSQNASRGNSVAPGGNSSARQGTTAVRQEQKIPLRKVSQKSDKVRGKSSSGWHSN